MAITKSLPVGNEAAVAQQGKTAAVNATAFAASLAAASKASGSAATGINATPVVAVKGQSVPVKGQQDLPGWGDVLDTSGEGTGDGAGQVNAGTDAGEGSSAVSSLIGKREIVEIAEGASGNEDLQQATVGAGMQQAVWTAGQSAGKTETPGNVLTGAVLPGQAKLDLVAHTGLQSVSELGKDVTASAAPVSEVPAAVSASPAVIQAPVQSEIGTVEKAGISASLAGQVQVQTPSFAAAGQPVAAPSADGSGETVKIATGKIVVAQTATMEPHKVSNAGLLRASEKETTVSGSARKAAPTAEATLNSADSSLVPSAGVEPGAALVASVSTPVTPVVTASPVVNEAKTTVDGTGVKTGTVGGSDVLPPSSGITDDVATASRTVARRPLSRLAEVGPRATASAAATGSAATTVKRSNEPGVKTGNAVGENIVGAAAVSTRTGDGSSAFPVVVGIAAAAPQVLSASEGNQTAVAGVQGVAAQVATVAKGQSTTTAVNDKNGNSVTSGVQRGTADAHGNHPAAVDSHVTVTASNTPESVATEKNSSTHEAGSTAAVAAVAGVPVAGSNAHVTTATGWNDGLVTAAAPVRAEVSGGTTIASASGTAKAEDGGQASGLGSGLSSGLVESGQGHTTLQATPTVLEVGVPGGTHGWLKIRAELNEGGTVQASVSSATEAGQETLRKELPAMSAYLQSEHVPVSLQMAHSVATVAGGTAATGLAAGDALAAGLGSGPGTGSHAGANPEQSRNDVTTFAGTSAGGADAGSLGSERQQGSDSGMVSDVVAGNSTDGVSAAVASVDTDWTLPQGYGGGVSLTTGGSWVNVIA